MVITAKILNKVRLLRKPAVSIYPIMIIITIPLLLIVNTLWNLKSFNRDTNFIVRHQAISAADILKPILNDNLSDPEELSLILQNAVQASPEIISAAILVKKENGLGIVSSTNDVDQVEELTQLGLNQLALGFDQPFAGLTYDPNLGQNVWSVVVPMENEAYQDYLLSVKLKTDTVNQILSRTSRDSLIILVILIVVTLVLLTNHFIFYQRSQRTKQLEELDKLKDEFISMAAHELRSPITGLVGYLELLRNKISPSQLPAIQSDLNILDNLTIDLRNLINDLLDVSRIEQKRLEFSFVDTQVNEVVKKVITAMTPTANQKGLKINFKAGSLPDIKTDPDRLRQIVGNLLGNSIKYTLKGEIAITTSLKKQFVAIEVKDTGIGIPPEELPNLFGKFHRVKDEKTHEVPGTGLGLWITKQMVELLGGKIYAESIYGTGTRITFTLPLKSVN